MASPRCTVSTVARRQRQLAKELRAAAPAQKAAARARLALLMRRYRRPFRMRAQPSMAQALRLAHEHIQQPPGEMGNGQVRAWAPGTRPPRFSLLDPTREEIRCLLGKIRNNAAPGPDTLSARFWKLMNGERPFLLARWLTAATAVTLWDLFLDTSNCSGVSFL